MPETEPQTSTGFLKNSASSAEKVFYTDRRMQFTKRIPIYPFMFGNVQEEKVPLCLARKFLFHLSDADLEAADLSPSEIEHIRTTKTAPEGFGVYFVLPRRLGVSDNIQYCCLMENKAYQRLKETLYPILAHDIQGELAYQEQHTKKRAIFVALNRFKTVMRYQDAAQIIYQMQSEQAFVNMPHVKGFIASPRPMDILPVQNGILLISHRLDSSAIGFRTVIVEVKTRSKTERARIDKEYAQVKPNLVRLFAKKCLKTPELSATLFPNLSQEDICHAAETGLLPRDYKYSAHHIRPRALGGLNEERNIIWMPNHSHLRLHRMIDVYLPYLDAHPELVAKSHVFAVIPAPQNYKGRALCFYDRATNRVLTFDDFASHELKRLQKLSKYQRHDFRYGFSHGMSRLVMRRHLMNKLMDYAGFQNERN